MFSGSVSVPLNLRMIRGGRRSGNRAASFSIRSEQNTEGGSGLDIWLGRGAMVGFAVAITVEIATGKGLLEVTTSKDETFFLIKEQVEKCNHNTSKIDLMSIVFFVQNFGVASPLPTVALAVTALVGVLTAVFIFQSSSKN